MLYFEVFLRQRRVLVYQLEKKKLIITVFNVNHEDIDEIRGHFLSLETVILVAKYNYDYKRETL